MVKEARALTGRSYLAAIVSLLQRVRLAHPTSGVWEAAEIEWWWRKQRPADERGQAFWFDDDGRPCAAAVATDWGARVALDVVTMPGSDPEWTAHVFHRGLAQLQEREAGQIEVMVDDADTVLVALLAAVDFTPLADKGTSAWMSAEQRPPVAPLAAGYRLTTHADQNETTHHFAARNGPAVGQRLPETSLYRPDLDLAIVDEENRVAAYGLFWNDPTTGVGFVEPMGTHESHRRRGLARHILTAGLEAVARAGVHAAEDQLRKQQRRVEFAVPECRFHAGDDDIAVSLEALA